VVSNDACSDDIMTFPADPDVSDDAYLTVQAETTQPTVLITSPAEGARWSNSVLIVRGKAADNAVVSAVYWTLKPLITEDNQELTQGTTNWTVSVPLTVPGTNFFRVRSQDSSGNYSPMLYRRFIYVLTDRLRVQATGKGTLSPNYSNAVLELGKSYSMTAKGASGHVFTNWVMSANSGGGVTNNSAKLTFVMISNLTLAVNFADVTKPVNTITTPRSGQRWSNAVFTVRGTATDNARVAGVWYQLNGGVWTNAESANGWSNWTATVNLTPGTNVVKAYAVDATGNRSITNSVNFVYVLIDRLRVQPTGKGTLSRNYSNSLLELGKSYSMTARGTSGYAFTNWVVSTNWEGGVTSSSAKLTFLMASNLTLAVNFVDVTKPANTITAPRSGQRWSNAVFTVTGTVKDNGPVAEVWYQINGGVWTNAASANGWSNWTATVNLTPGTNAVKAYAVDAAGNRSITNSVNFVYVLTDRLRMQVTGKGTLSPNYSNAVLELGKSYSMKATAASGYAFTNWVVSTNWVDGVTTNNATVRFFMQSNLTLQVNFVDVAKPVNTITAPKSGQRWSNAVFTVRGTATDNASVAEVRYQLNSGVWSNAVGTSNWTAEVTLTPGTNVVKAYAVDATGNKSTTNNVSFVYVYVATSAARSAVVLLPPQITGITLAGTTATVSFTSVTGLIYSPECKNILPDSSWTPLPASASGTDSILSLTDTNAPPQGRFYRIRAQLPP
jgi:carbon monoxide dehydrogenase subunit G